MVSNVKCIVASSQNNLPLIDSNIKPFLLVIHNVIKQQMEQTRMIPEIPLALV
jgi:hypothetical protein